MFKKTNYSSYIFKINFMILHIYIYIFLIFTDPISEETKILLGDRKKKKEVIPAEGASKIEIRMAFKKYIFSKKMAQ